MEEKTSYEYSDYPANHYNHHNNYSNSYYDKGYNHENYEYSSGQYRGKGPASYRGVNKGNYRGGRGRGHYNENYQ